MPRKRNLEQLRLFFVNAVIILVTVAAMSFVCVYSVARDLTDDRTFARGITINGLDLSGMTFSDAKRRLERYCDDELSALGLNLTYNGSSYVYSVSELGGAINVLSTLERAFNIGKTADGTGDSLADAELAHDLNLEITVDREILIDCLQSIAQQWNVPAVNAEAVFDPQTRTFTYKEGETGWVIDVDANVDAVAERLSRSDFSPFELLSHEAVPEYTVEALKKNTELLASYSSDTSANANRNNNIKLMCDYVNGYVIMPGETLSINELVGERTLDKGFMEAPAIMDGKRLENDIGGGICQLSGTLYNTALWANMEIVERWPHSWPSDYLITGLDSTLDWNTQKDLKIRNTTDYPMYIAAWLQNSNLSYSNVLTVQMYGSPLPEGVTIDIRSEIVETIDPGAANVVYVNSLPAGQTKVVITSRTGYRTRVWRDFYYNGVLIDSEPMSSSYYRPIPGEIQVGRGTGYTPTTPNPADNQTEPPATTDQPVVTDPPPTQAPEETLIPPPTDPEHEIPIGD